MLHGQHHNMLGYPRQCHGRIYTHALHHPQFLKAFLAAQGQFFLVDGQLLIVDGHGLVESFLTRARPSTWPPGLHCCAFLLFVPNKQKCCLSESPHRIEEGGLLLWERKGLCTIDCPLCAAER
jgi:hypothetical protein